MNPSIGCDAHKEFSMFVELKESGQYTKPVRVPHSLDEYRWFLRHLIPQRSSIAFESVGNWYWMADEMEKAGHRPILTHPGKAKKMMGHINKSDKLDAEGLAMLLRNNTIPEVWIPPADLRDRRELPRTRMALVKSRTQFKNRIQATLAKYNLTIDASDVFGKGARPLLEEAFRQLPPETQKTVKVELDLVDQLEEKIAALERQIHEQVTQTPEMQLLRSIPGVGDILAIVIAMEIGSVDRFAGPSQLACYSGTVPRLHGSAGKIFHGRVRKDINQYLKWAFVEAANVIMMNQNRWSQRHAVRLYRRIKERKGHPKAIVAVARHLAEACYWILKKREEYKDPVLSTQE